LLAVQVDQLLEGDGFAPGRRPCPPSLTHASQGE
jgi:hypothetical protein